MSDAARRPIRRLDEATVRRIAAGEVVERPASVVKELVENSVDSGASEVRVRLEGGGLDAIVVDDDGHGILPEELPLALERHATSKLDSAEDLSVVSTLGFRGEALAAIGSVARLRIISRPPGSEEAHGLSLVAGAKVGEFVQGRAPGTTVEVRDLFFNTPARRKFLHAAVAEQVEVADTIERLYLARPSVGLTLSNERGELARLPPAATLRDAAGRVLGPEFLQQSFEVRAGLGTPVELRAILARPALSRSNLAGLYLSVNGRSVHSRVLLQAVRQAYADYLPKTRSPIGVLHLSLDLARVDVNVHPTKREVRIAREREVADVVRAAVRSALTQTPHVADRTVVPSAGPRASGPFLSPPSGIASDVETRSEPLVHGARPPTAQRTLVPPPGPVAVAAGAHHPALRLIGPIFALYWLAESDGALVLVDQHAASERVLYEELRRTGRLARQELVEPVLLELGARRAEVLSAHAETVDRSGFAVEPFGPGAYRLHSVPTYRGRRARADQLVALLDELAGGGRPTVPDGMLERADAMVACHAAIRAGDVVSAEEMQRVLDALYALPDASYACPHGRPILVRFDRGRIDRWFLRSPP